MEDEQNSTNEPLRIYRSMRQAIDDLRQPIIVRGRLIPVEVRCDGGGVLRSPTLEQIHQTIDNSMYIDGIVRLEYIDGNSSGGSWSDGVEYSREHWIGFNIHRLELNE
jgi:hypothetical protein